MLERSESSSIARVTRPFFFGKWVGTARLVKGYTICKLSYGNRLFHCIAICLMPGSKTTYFVWLLDNPCILAVINVMSLVNYLTLYGCQTSHSCCPYLIEQWHLNNDGEIVYITTKVTRESILIRQRQEGTLLLLSVVLVKNTPLLTTKNLKYRANSFIHYDGNYKNSKTKFNNAI